MAYAGFYTKEWWQTQIAQAEEWKRTTSTARYWDRVDQYYSHDAYMGDEIKPNFNLIYMLGSTMIPSLLFQTPHIVNNPRRFEYRYWSQIYNGILNWVYDTMGVKEVGDNAVLNAFLYNIAPIELGYDFPGAQGTEIRGLLGDMDFTRIPNQYDRHRAYNLPWMDVIDPRLFLVAAGTKSMRNCRWYGKLITLPLRVVKEFPGINKEAAIATSVYDDTNRNHMPKWMDVLQKCEEYISYYEIHCAERQSTFLFTTEGEFLTTPEEDPMQVAGLPLEVLTFNHDPRHIWGTPDSLYVESQMLEGNECRMFGRLQRKVALVKFLIKGGYLDEDEVEKFLQGDPAVAIQVKNVNPDEKIQDIIATLQPHVQLEYHEYQKNLLNDAQLLSGMGPNQTGMYAPGRRTKYESQVVEQSHMVRTGQRRLEVGSSFEKHASRVKELVSKHWHNKIVARVVGRDASIFWVEVSPQELADVGINLTTKVNIESLTPTSRESRRGEMIEVLGLLSKFEGVDIMPILYSFLSTFDWKAIDENLPLAAGPQMGVQEFQQQQQGQMQNPQAMNQLQANLGGVGNAINGLPGLGAGA